MFVCLVWHSHGFRLPGSISLSSFLFFYQFVLFQQNQMYFLFSTSLTLLARESKFEIVEKFFACRLRNICTYSLIIRYLNFNCFLNTLIYYMWGKICFTQALHLTTAKRILKFHVIPTLESRYQNQNFSWGFNLSNCGSCLLNI